MHSAQQISDAKERENHYGKTCDGEVSGTAATPANGDAHMEIQRVNQPCDGGPSLLGIPTPIRAPGLIGPVGSGGDGQCEQGKRQADGPVSDSIKCFRRGKQALDIRSTPYQQQEEKLNKYAPRQAGRKKGT